MKGIRSIRGRILGSYVFITLLTLFIIETILFMGVKKYYYDSIEKELRKQGQVAGKIYYRYANLETFKIDAETLIYTFSDITAAQVHIIDKDKNVVQDSHGIYQGEKENYGDVDKALSGKESIWIGEMKYSVGKLMTFSYPLKSRNGDTIEGVVRYITSLEHIDEEIHEIYIFLICIGAFIISLITIVSMVISKTITEPINTLNKTAKQMSKGDFTTRAEKRYEDEVGELSDTLNYMSEEILKNEKLKNEFISSISHEIRTPLTSIKGWTITLRTGDMEDKEELKTGIEIIEGEAERLSGLVEELLDFSRLISGRMKLNIKPFFLEELLDNVYKQMLPRARRQGIDLCLEVSEEVKNNLKIEGDYNRFKQVLINLLDNSFKFTESGFKVCITGELLEESARLSVKDQGMGISEEHLCHIKQKFYKVNTKDGGSGIGLSVCDEIIKLHEGKLQIISEKGKGTDVIIDVPIIRH